MNPLAVYLLGEFGAVEIQARSKLSYGEHAKYRLGGQHDTPRP